MGLTDILRLNSDWKISHDSNVFWKIWNLKCSTVRREISFSCTKCNCFTLRSRLQVSLFPTLTRMRLRSPKWCICFCVSGCVWLFKPQENQPELNKTRHSHPSQSLPIAADDRQNADTTLLSNWILDIIYSCFNMSGKSCGNNTQSLTFVLVLAPLFPVCWRIDGWMKRLNVIWYKSCVFSVTCGQANISTQRNAR